MEVKRLNTKLITPHIPTPQNLKNYKLSFLDKLQPPMNAAVVLFYQSKPENNTHLEESLAKILVQFYPLAGRYIKNDYLIDCNDEGAEFIEAEAPNDVVLIDVVAKADPEEFNDLIPDQYFRVDEGLHDPLLSIQATRFPCGGLAIAISVSHRVFDISSLGTFIAAWSNISNPDKKVELITPSFDLPLLLPYEAHDFGIVPKKPNLDNNNNNNVVVVRRFLFNKMALTKLRSKIRPRNGKPISGVRVVCAVIAKALILIDHAKHGGNRNTVIFQPINMRERTVPPQPKHACGNFSFASITRCIAASEMEQIDIEELYDVIGDAVRKSIGDYAEKLSLNRDSRDIIINPIKMLMKLSQNQETNIIVFSDRSKFGFYEADFGWGKPVWTTIGRQKQPIARRNFTVVMSNKEGDGIEAWLHLDRNDMLCFEEDEEIKLYTSY